MSIHAAVITLCDTLAALPGFNTCRIGLEANMTNSRKRSGGLLGPGEQRFRIDFVQRPIRKRRKLQDLGLGLAPRQDFDKGTKPLALAMRTNPAWAPPALAIS